MGRHQGGFPGTSHPDEAYDAVKALDGREKLGKRLRVSGDL